MYLNVKGFVCELIIDYPQCFCGDRRGRSGLANLLPETEHNRGLVRREGALSPICLSDQKLPDGQSRARIWE